MSDDFEFDAADVDWYETSVNVIAHGIADAERQLSELPPMTQGHEMYDFMARRVVKELLVNRGVLVPLSQVPLAEVSS